MNLNIRNKSWKIPWEYFVAPFLIVLSILVLLISSNAFSKETWIGYRDRPPDQAASSSTNTSNDSSSGSNGIVDNSKTGTSETAKQTQTGGVDKAESEKSSTQTLQAADKNNSLKVNINSASLDELMTLPYIGEVKAKAIISYRKEHGPFAKAEDLLNIKGIGPKTLEKLRPFIEIK